MMERRKKRSISLMSGRGGKRRRRRKDQKGKGWLVSGNHPCWQTLLTLGAY